MSLVTDAEFIFGHDGFLSIDLSGERAVLRIIAGGQVRQYERRTAAEVLRHARLAINYYRSAERRARSQ